MSAPITSIEASNSLADLAARIRTYHEATVEALKHSVEHAMSAGDCLIEAKAQLNHGEWLPWLQDHCRITQRTAQRYMRLSRNRDTVEAKSDTMSDLTINGALALLTTPRETLQNGLLDSFVDNLDAQEALANALRSQAEIARREVLWKATEANLEAQRKIFEKFAPGRSGLDDAITDDMMAAEANEWLNRLGLPPINNFSNAYQKAVDSNDFERAFALAQWLHDSTQHLLKITQECADAVAAGKTKDQGFAEVFTVKLVEILSDYAAVSRAVAE
jgi:DUF3102 family protein